MAPKHKYSGASASITTRLNALRIADVCEIAAKRSETLEILLRLEEKSPTRLLYSARKRMTGGHVVTMKFEVSVKEIDGVRNVRTRILSYKVNRTWILVIPLPWQMTAWRNYKEFMYALVDGIESDDAGATSFVVEAVV
jgi:hypothetical protein